MESILGRGYSINEESGLIDQYSPLSSTIDEDIEQDDDLFYPEEDNVGEEEEDSSSTVPTSNATLSSSSIDEISGMGLGAFKPPPFKMMPVEATPPPTPLVPRRLLDPINSTTNSFQMMTINTNLPLTPPRSAEVTNTNWSLGPATNEIRNNNNNLLHPRVIDTTPKTTTTTSLLTPTSIDRYLNGHRRLSDSAYTSSSSSTLDLPLANLSAANRYQPSSAQPTEVTNETSNIYSYMDHLVDGLPSNINTSCAPSTTTASAWSALINSNDANYTQLSTKTPLNSSNSTLNSKISCQNVCRKCIFPKPTRAHHCSICARCILNQDHHCPWINNCVGHLNHRYFFQFCFFLTLGSFYAATLGFSEFQHFLFGRKVFSYVDLMFGGSINETDILPSVTNPSLYYTFLFLFIVAITACIVLFGFTLWHFWLISNAETTIEFHTNSTERKRLKELKEKFINPYDLGFVLNWKMFLGLNKWHEIIYRNFLPSTHRPFCDGINWPMRKLTKSFEEKKKLIMMHV